MESTNFFTPLKMEEIMNAIDAKSKAGGTTSRPTEKKPEVFINALDSDGQLAAMHLMVNRSTSEIAVKLFLSDFEPTTVEQMMNSIDQKFKL